MFILNFNLCLLYPAHGMRVTVEQYSTWDGEPAEADPDSEEDQALGGVCEEPQQVHTERLRAETWGTKPEQQVTDMKI